MIFQNCRKSHCRISQFPILFLPSYRNYTLSLPPLISINFHRNRNNCWESSSFENSSRSRFFIFLFHFISRLYRVYNFESTQDGNTRRGGVSRGGRTGANGTNALHNRSSKARELPRVDKGNTNRARAGR